MLQVAFASMFLLAFGLSAFGLGLFTTYFGAGKSRMIGVILTLIGIVVLLIFYLMAIDHFGYGWASDDVKDSFLGVLGITIGGILSFALVIILMMIIKEPEPEIPGIEDWEKELAAMDTDKPEEEKEPKAEGEESEEKGPSEDVPEPEGEGDEGAGETKEADEGEKDSDEADGSVGEEPTDAMAAFLKDKEEKKIVKEEWEKVDDEASITAPEETGEPADGPELPGEEEPADGPEHPGEEGPAEGSDEPEEDDPEPQPPMEDDDLPENPEEADEVNMESEPEPGEDAIDDGEVKKEGD